MPHCPGDARQRARTRRYWRAAAARRSSGTPRPFLTRTTRNNRNPRGREDRSALHPAQPAQGSQAVVRTVAERLAGGRFAAAEPDLFSRLGSERNRRQPGALMRAVAEGLRGAAPAGAPEIPLTGLDGDAVGLFLRGYRCVHSFAPAIALASVRVLWRLCTAARTVCERRQANKPGQWLGRPGRGCATAAGPVNDTAEKTIWPSTPMSPMTSSGLLSPFTTSERCCPARESPRGSRTRIFS